MSLSRHSLVHKLFPIQSKEAGQRDMQRKNGNDITYSGVVKEYTLYVDKISNLVTEWNEKMSLDFLECASFCFV